MRSSVAVLLTVSVAAVLAADPVGVDSAASEDAVFGVRVSRRSSVAEQHLSRLSPDTARRPRGLLRRQGDQDPITARRPLGLLRRREDQDPTNARRPRGPLRRQEDQDPTTARRPRGLLRRQEDQDPTTARRLRGPLRRQEDQDPTTARRPRALLMHRRAQDLLPQASQRLEQVRDPTIELDGTVEQSRLFTADPEAASAGKLYRQLALYSAEPSAPSDDSNQKLEKPSEAKTGLETTLTEEELLFADGDFGRRLQPQKQSTALPAYPPYSHGPLAVPIEPYRSPEYGPVSGEAQQRQRTPATPGPSLPVLPVLRETAEPRLPEVPLQGVEEDPVAPIPERKPTVKEMEPVGYPAGRVLPQKAYQPRTPAEHTAPTGTQSLKSSKPPYKVIAPTGYQSEPSPARTSSSDRLNELHSDSLRSPHGRPRHTYGPLRSVPVYLPARPHSDRPGSGRPGSDGYHHRPLTEYHPVGQRRGKKLGTGGFKGEHLVSQHHYQPELVHVSYRARTGKSGAFEWFSEHPVGSSHH